VAAPIWNRSCRARRDAIRLAVALGLAGAAMLEVGSARAQTQGSGFAVDRFEPAGAGSEWFSLESLDFRGRVRPAFSLMLDGAWKPLVVYDQNGSAVATLLRDQVVAHAGAGVVLGNRLRLDLNVPVVLYQQGTTLVLNDQMFTAPAHMGVGDARLGADVRLVGQTGGPFVGAVGVQVFVPAGGTSAFTGDGAWRVWPRILMAGDIRTFSWAAQLGFHVRPSDKCDCSLTPGNELTAAVSAGVRPSPQVLIGPEVTLSSATAHLAHAVASPVELLLGAHFGVAQGWTLSAGVGPGLTDGLGSPALRAVVGLQYVQPTEIPMAVPRPVAAAPVARKKPPRPTPAPPPPPPPPPPDQDGDGIPDAEDACPAEAGEKSDDPKKNGCPPPKDTDGDGILDPEDACPADAGPRNDDPARNGCPVVRIENGQIRIREQVKFKTASATILKESDYILQAVVKILVEHPEITKVRVEGHTDTRGKPAYNKKLSQRRAASVMKWLVKHGIKKKRLTSAGYGQERPIATNMTEDGRRQNRRSEFHIVEGPGAEQAP
jgi:outer membrane protein OmpA-like peptidoglycan-associated protein